jgi:hypothetical protein
VSIPVTNDKAVTAGTDPSLRARPRDNSQARPSTAEEAGPDRPELDVDAATHLFNAASGAQAAGGGRVGSETQARSLVEQLKAGIAADPAGALQAFGGANPKQAAALLTGAPG